MSLLDELFPSTSDFLNEAVNYEQQFGDLFKVLKEIETQGLGETEALGRAAQQWIDRVVPEARRTLKKNDRIVWFLRLAKIGLAQEVFDEFSRGRYAGAVKTVDPQAVEMLKQYVERLERTYVQKSSLPIATVKEDAWAIYHGWKNKLTNLEHYLSLPIAAITNKVFQYDALDDVETAFEEAEDEWKNRVKDAFVDDDAETIISFPDGFAWVNTNRAACDKEAAAMGHCGNAPRRHSSDQLLSLRKVIEHQGQTFYKPYLTFILDSDGMLGEMKGRYNEKPEPEFHAKIVALLKHPIVNGIKGGGYRPENNFSLNDLPNSVAEDLLELKPELGGLYEFYKKYGLDDSRVQQRIQDGIDDLRVVGSVEYVAEEKAFILEKWPDVEDFMREIDDEVVLGLIEAMEENDVDAGDIVLSIETIEDIIFAMTDREYGRLMRVLGLDAYQPNDTIPYRRSVLRAARAIKDSDLYVDLLEVYARFAKISETFKDKVKERIAEYIDIGYSLNVYELVIDMDSKNIEAEVTAKIDGDALVRILSASDDDYDDYGHVASQIRHDGWFSIDWYSTNESRTEKGLATKAKGDPFLAELRTGTAGVNDIGKVAGEFAKRLRL